MVASAGNDHRLGANEAPPAIISIFLGEQLSDIISQLENGSATSSKKGKALEIGLSSLPKLAQDVTDRNRTSPFAFTGNKFEFRAVGSNQSCASPNTALNVIVAEALDDMLTVIETEVAKGADLNSVLQKLLQKEIKAHKRVLFDGNGYSDNWKAEAEKRGLPNLVTTLDAIEAYKDPKIVALYKKYNVLSKVELDSRYEIARENYDTIVAIEAECCLQMAKTMILPAGIGYASELADSLDSLQNFKHAGVQKYATAAADLTESLVEAISHLESSIAEGNPTKKLAAMAEVRKYADSLEKIVPETEWPLPSYEEMFFVG